MSFIDDIAFLLRLTRSEAIIRRYFVTNAFDATLTIMGLLTGFWVSGDVEVAIILNACLAAAIALGISGVSSTYISEVAERKKELRELEQAMVADLQDTLHSRGARLAPVFIALASGLAPVAAALPIVLGIWLSGSAFLAFPPISTGLFLSLGMLFVLGLFLGMISHQSLLWSGLRTLIIALVTAGLIYLLV